MIERLNLLAVNIQVAVADHSQAGDTSEFNSLHNIKLFLQKSDVAIYPYYIELKCDFLISKWIIRKQVENSDTDMPVVIMDSQERPLSSEYMLPSFFRAEDERIKVHYEIHNE